VSVSISLRLGYFIKLFGSVLTSYDLTPMGIERRHRGILNVGCFSRFATGHITDTFPFLVSNYIISMYSVSSKSKLRRVETVN
jgi:hypothetical protein